jgi:hypothetical protein
MRLKVIELSVSVCRLSWQDRLLLVEAFLYLAIAGFAVAVLPFRHVGDRECRGALCASNKGSPHN